VWEMMDSDVFSRLFKLAFDVKYCKANKLEHKCIFLVSGSSGSGKTFLVNELCSSNEIKLLRYIYNSSFLEEENVFLNIYRNAVCERPCCSLAFLFLLLFESKFILMAWNFLLLSNLEIWHYYLI
jgi:hypothetical protein